jgi:hypothetical protein
VREAAKTVDKKTVLPYTTKAFHEGTQHKARRVLASASCSKTERLFGKRRIFGDELLKKSVFVKPLCFS